MIKFENYKSSNIFWLNKIPQNWKNIRGKDLFIEYSIKGHGDLPLLAASQKQGVVLKTMLESRSMEAQKDFDNFKLVKIGDFVISLRSFEGGIETAYYTGVISPAYTVFNFITNEENDTSYFKYLFKSSSFISFLQSSITGIRDGQSVKFKEIQNAFFGIPNLEVQYKIGTFLDTKTKAIDNKIEILLKKISNYKEYRKRVINDAVTKGLNNDCKTKCSEYDFEVNNNFNLFRLKDLGYLYSGLSGKSGDDFNQDENKNNKGFIPFTNIANNTYLKKDHLGAVVVYENENQNKVQKGDIFFLMSSEGYEDIGKSAILDDDLEETYLNSFCKGYRVTNKKANPYFLNYLLLSDSYRKQLTIEGKGFTRINLKMEKVNDFKVYLPNSIDEQTKIVQFLDQKTQTIDNIIVNINKQIETLKELRKTLINDVVTGKIKVVDN